MDILKDFSDYALNQGWCVDGESTQNGFLFYNAQTNERWIGWQAAKSQATPEGFVFVPTEITQAMVDSLHYGGYAWGDKEGTREYFQDVYRRMIEAQEPIRE